MSMKGKREAPHGGAPEWESRDYELASRGDEEADRLDTERRLEERRRQRALAEGEAPAPEQADDGGAAPGRGVKKELIILCAVLAAVLAGLLLWRSIFVKPEFTPSGSDGADDQQQQEEIDVGDGLQPVLSGVRKSENFYTFLILGRDTGGGGNCDTMLLASYDITNQKATVMSIPRDTLVNVPWDVKKINSVYNHYGAGDKGIEKLKIEISKLVGFQPDYTVVVEWEAVGELVDAIGGVWFDVPRDMRYWDSYQDLRIVVDKGYQKLDGTTAMGVVRWRKNSDGGGYAEGDLGRIKTQQAFLKAVISQVLQVKNAVKLFEFAEIFEKNVKTELSVQNLFWFAKEAVLGGLRVENVEFVTMPNKAVNCWSRLVGNMQSYVVPRSGELLELVNTRLSPFQQVFTLSDLDIMSVNADGSISSTTGRVEDTKAAQPPVTSGGEPVDPDAPAEDDPEEGITGGETTTEPTTPPEPSGETGEPVTPDVPTGGETADPTTPDEPATDPTQNGGEGFIDDGTGW